MANDATGPEEEAGNAASRLEISPEKVCYIIIKARELDAQVETDDPDSGSNPSDDRAIDVLEDVEDNPTAEELEAFIDSLNEDEQVQLVALAWLGRGDYTIESWDEAVAEARAAHNDRTADYLIGTPLLGDYLEQGLAAHQLSCEEYELGRL
ncbi:MAG: DUF3775 domain-containing protein [Rhodospirillaceae bacterium]|nr:DUF3775 domain-containing protein [Rhodospirillaceae bacterium]